MIDFDTEKFHVNPNYRLQFEEAQQCHVLLYPEGLVKLSDTAVEILRRCEKPTTRDFLIEELKMITLMQIRCLPTSQNFWSMQPQKIGW